MKTLTLHLPDVAELNQVKMVIVVFLYSKGILSSGQASDLAGISRKEILETAGKYHISIFGDTAEDLKNTFGKGQM